MRSSTRQALAIWRDRDPGEREGPVFVIYATAVAALVTAVPSAWVLWSALTTHTARALLLSPMAPRAAMLMSALLWSGALIVGRIRGPAVRAPFLTSALSTAPAPRAVSFGAPVAKGVAILLGAAAFTGGLIGAAIGRAESVEPTATAAFAIACLGAGLMTGSAWLLGQIFARSALTAALILAAGGLMSVLVDPVPVFLPWGWVAAAYPVDGSLLAAAALLITAMVMMGAAVGSMAFLRRRDLEVQAQRWDTAQVFASTHDLGAASAVYQARPTRLRAVLAVRRVRSPLARFILRDALGVIRTPSRAAMGAVSMASAGVLLGAARDPFALWCALAGALVYLGIGPFSDGLRHAVAMSADLPLYGLSDRALVAYQSVLPTICAVLFTAMGGGVSLVFASESPDPARLLLTVLCVVMVTILARVAATVKGPLPVSLLAPVPTPMGDLGIVVRLLWLLDGILLAALGGLFSATEAWPVAGIELVCIGLLVIRRWRRRRHA